MIQDMVLAAREPQRFDEKYATLLSAEQRAELKQGLLDIRGTIIAEPGPVILDLVGDVGDFVQRYYSKVLERVENAGHRFGEDLQIGRASGRERVWQYVKISVVAVKLKKKKDKNRVNKK